jgi:hypothetical protein
MRAATVVLSLLVMVAVLAIIGTILVGVGDLLSTATVRLDSVTAALPR